MNRINKLFHTKSARILSIYCTAGYPSLHATVPVIQALAQAGVDMIEIGIPYSDPMADGPVIQESSARALHNGMSLRLLLDQLRNIRQEIDIPLLLMGYLNPVLQYGMEKFCGDCAKTGIDGVILPDLPLQTYRDEYRLVFEEHGLQPVFLLSPQTGDDRIRIIDEASRGFIYMVSSSATTGIKGKFSAAQIGYFSRIRDMRLSHPALIGFGIADREGFDTACQYAQGAIIGSAFVKMLAESGFSEASVKAFISNFRP